jgi:hypothetical protein
MSSPAPKPLWTRALVKFRQLYPDNPAGQVDYWRQMGALLVGDCLSIEMDSFLDIPGPVRILEAWTYPALGVVPHWDHYYQGSPRRALVIRLITSEEYCMMRGEA